MRRIRVAELEYGPVSIWFDPAVREYQVRVRGNKDATYFTDDLADAKSTAQRMRNNLEELLEGVGRS